LVSGELEWVQLVREKSAQVEHPVGGVQAHDKGFSRAGRVLGVTRIQVQRAEKMAGISAAAKAEIRRVNLRVKRDLLAIARLPPDEQVAMVQQLAGPKVRTVPVRGTPPPEDQPAAAQNQGPATPPPDESKQAEEPTQAEDKAEGQEGEVVDSPSTTPPEIVDPLELDGEQQYVAFKARWGQCCDADFKALSAAMQARFAAELLSMAALAAGNSEGPR
jgi:hypothetical protein